jgi:hypothetical protein
MTNRNFFILLIYVLLIFSISLNAQEVKEQNRLAFTPIKISSVNVYDSFHNEVSGIIQENLKGESFFVIRELYNPYTEITFNNCIKNQCTAELPNAVSEGIVIMIYIDSFTVKTGERMVSRYVTEDITENRYSLYISTAEILKDRYDLEFSGTFKERSKLLNEADLIGKKIREFYIKRKPEIKKKEKESDKESESSSFYDITAVSFSLSKIKPAGSFNGIADDGVGGAAVLNGFLPSFAMFTLNPEISFYSLSSSDSTVNSAYMILPGFTLGYNFKIDDELSFAPLAGIGYSVMYVDGTAGDDQENAGTDYYYNPVLKAGVEGAYYLADNFSIICGVSYSCIVEKDSLLYFRSFNLGIRVGF